MKRLIVAIAIVALLPVWVDATIINIPDDYPTIQEGIDHGSHGDTILVQPDTYYENLNFNGHNVVLASLFLTTGDTTYVSSTIIDGDSAGSVITFDSGEDSTAQVVGFTIQNGYEYQGGGIHCYYSSPTIRNNVISRNEGWYGAGIYCGYSNPTISNNIVSDNLSELWLNGSWILCWYSSPTIEGNTITGNGDPAQGGGIACAYCTDAVISGNTISSNSCWDFGGGICFRYSTGVISHNVINDNIADIVGGGGIYCGDSSPDIVNNTISGNSAPGGFGGGILCEHPAPPITNTIIWGNSGAGAPQIGGNPTVSYCDVQGGWPGTGNIDAEPVFVGPEREDFHLRWHSRCIDAGDPEFLDPDGTRSDIGAFYFNQRVPGIVELYPRDTPIVIPPEGGDIIYDGWAFNFSGHSRRADIWTYAFVPEMGQYGPIDLYENIRIPADSLGMNEISQHVPGAAPEGDYVFVAYVGYYPSTIIDSSYFYFTKSGSIAGGMNDWFRADRWLKESNLAESDVPVDYALSQNYPNPFNASTVINYQLPAESHVKLEVYNTLGQKVTMLLDEKQAAGYRSVVWEASEISSGIYFYRLAAGNFTSRERMLLLR